MHPELDYEQSDLNVEASPPTMSIQNWVSSTYRLSFSKDSHSICKHFISSAQQPLECECNKNSNVERTPGSVAKCRVTRVTMGCFSVATSDQVCSV